MYLFIIIYSINSVHKKTDILNVFIQFTEKYSRKDKIAELSENKQKIYIFVILRFCLETSFFLVIFITHIHEYVQSDYKFFLWKKIGFIFITDLLKCTFNLFKHTDWLKKIIQYGFKLKDIFNLLEYLKFCFNTNTRSH